MRRSSLPCGPLLSALGHVAHRCCNCGRRFSLWAARAAPRICIARDPAAGPAGEAVAAELAPFFADLPGSWRVDILAGGSGPCVEVDGHAMAFRIQLTSPAAVRKAVAATFRAAGWFV